jgi:hypothetical protein
MRTKPVVAPVVLAACAALLAAAVQPPAAGAHQRHRVPRGTHMLLTFDHNKSLKRGTVIRDDSGHRHRGVVLTAHGGSIRSVPGVFHRAAGFPVRCCGRAIIQVADRKGLDPRRRPFVFGAAVKLGHVQARGDSNVVQKGFFRQAGGQYKLQLDAGVPSCVMYGGKGRVILAGRKSVADRSWHRLSCLRTPTRIQLRVDGKVVAGAKATVGFIGNDAPIRIGGKKIKRGNDQYHGAIDSVFLRLL